MGRLTDQIGEKPEQYVYVPFYCEDLRREASRSWNDAGICRLRDDELATEIKNPEKTVLYILGHSGRGVDVIGSNDEDDEDLSPGDLVDKLIANDLPHKILAIKIWACFTGVNGFAQGVKAKFLDAKMGYNPIVVGYDEGTGGPYDTGADNPKKHVFQVQPDGTRGALIGRASANRSIF